MGENQTAEEQILGNTAGSPRYFNVLITLTESFRFLFSFPDPFLSLSLSLSDSCTIFININIFFSILNIMYFLLQFLKKLGSMIRLKGTRLYTGGLDTREDHDGPHTLHWRNSVTQVLLLPLSRIVLCCAV